LILARVAGLKPFHDICMRTRLRGLLLAMTNRATCAAVLPVQSRESTVHRTSRMPLAASGPRHCLPGRYLTSDRTRSGSLLMRRQAAAMLVAPCRRWRLTARLRKVAMTCGP